MARGYALSVTDREKAMKRLETVVLILSTLLRSMVSVSCQKKRLMNPSKISKHAKKHGGIDKRDMLKVASMLRRGNKAGALKFTKTLDSDPRDLLQR